MIVTMDKAGRLVIPRSMREQIGLVAGPVDVHVVGNRLQVEILPDEPALVDDDEWLLIDAGGPGMAVDELREVRLVDQR